MNKQHTKDAAKDAKDVKRVPKKLRCNGCNRPSDDIACPSCLASNGRKCEKFGCNRNLPADSTYNYCKACLCSTNNCNNAIVDGEAFCQQCINQWNVTCYICSKRRASVSFQTCRPCDEARGYCEQCRRAKVAFNQNSKTFLKYCSRCLCKSCKQNLHQEDLPYCETCQTCLCIDCGRGFREIGSELCDRCMRRQTQPCGNPDCSGLARFDLANKAFYDFCKDCTCRGCGRLNDGGEARLCESCHLCAAPNCSRITPGPKHEYCARCNDEYRNGRVKCIGKHCKLYTRKENAICGACTENEVAPVTMRKAEESGTADKPKTSKSAAEPPVTSTPSPKPKAVSAKPVAAPLPVPAPAVTTTALPLPKLEPLVNSIPSLPAEPVVLAKVPPPASMTVVVKGCATVVVIPSPDCTAEKFDAVSLAIRGLAESQGDHSSSPSKTPSPSASAKGKVRWGDCAA